jgi:hypothetical protein
VSSQDKKMPSIPDLVGQTNEAVGDEVFYYHSNGLTIKTEKFFKSDTQRILPLGSPQGSLMNHLLNFPERVLNKRVFEPFAGSGALGFMTLKAGAEHVDFLDINPRAADFHRANAELNQFRADQFKSVTGDIATYMPERKYDLILANPPFVPVPDELEGSLTSNGGPEGNRFVDIALDRLEQFLEPDGRALIYVFQFVKQGEPLIFERLSHMSRTRSIEVTPTQEHFLPLETYSTAYGQLFPKRTEVINRWQSWLVERHGTGLTLCHYVIDIGPQSEKPTRCAIRKNFAEKFGDHFLVPSKNPEELAFSRACENFVPPPLATS